MDDQPNFATIEIEDARAAWLERRGPGLYGPNAAVVWLGNVDLKIDPHENLTEVARVFENIAHALKQEQENRDEEAAERYYSVIILHPSSSAQ